MIKFTCRVEIEGELIMNNGKGNMILLTVMSIATLLVAVVGATFAYFSAMMGKGNASPTIEVTSGTISTEFNSDSNLVSGYVNPSEVVASRDITVTGVVTGSNNLNYEATLVVNNNTYLDGELVYTITSTNESNNGSIITSTTEPVAIPAGASTIVLGNGVFAGPTTAGLSHKYTITITRANQVEQNTDKAFEAKLFVTQAKK